MLLTALRMHNVHLKSVVRMRIDDRLRIEFRPIAEIDLHAAYWTGQHL